MITISCVDPEDHKIYEMNVKSYDLLTFKKDIEEDKYYIMIAPEAKWYSVPFEEYDVHLEESENEDGACDLEIDLDG